MTDIVERLLKRSQWLWTTEQQLSDNKLVKEAADEIEHLRKRLTDLVICVEDGCYCPEGIMAAAVDEANELLKRGKYAT